MAYWISERKRVVEQARRNLGFILKYLIMIIRTKFDIGQKVWTVVDSTPRQAIGMAPIIKPEAEIYLSKPKMTKSI